MWFAAEALGVAAIVAAAAFTLTAMEAAALIGGEP